MTLLSRGSPSQLTLLVDQIVHTYTQPITSFVVGFFFTINSRFNCYSFQSNNVESCDSFRAHMKSNWLY
ncbi:hypothetical protein F0242_17025 [Vibrio rotiferianus]|nr:hypothetical protein [Vibrio rotiferianus]TMX56545.1 hypothetical protein DA097_23805 [Vibrio rotiferianus]